MDRIPITVEGKKRLEEELLHLKRVERPRVIQAIAEARAHGDLSENAEYDAAKEKQSFIEGRIQELEDKLSRLEVIDPRQVRSDCIVFGATVTLLDVETEKKQVYQIVGADESDIKQGKISIDSPIARALIQKREGDVVVVRIPRGEVEYEILKVEYK